MIHHVISVIMWMEMIIIRIVGHVNRKEDTVNVRIGLFEVLWIAAIIMILSGVLIPLGILFIIVATIVRFRYYLKRERRTW